MINLIEFIEGGDAEKVGGYTGAIFLTYTLNLHFYEQIVGPALDRAGCANVIIIADQDGYSGAINMGARAINGAGLRYVCEPLRGGGNGVQHVKILLMAGPNIGRLLIGSGNLTMHGYGRNLELYSGFEYRLDKDPLGAKYPFIEVWDLITELDRQNYLSNVARNRLQIIRESVDWLKTPVEETNDFRVWYNMEVPIWEQLQTWRGSQGFGGDTLDLLQVISPYYDKDIKTVHQGIDELLPTNLELYLSNKITNLNGAHLKDSWRDRETELAVSEILPKDLESTRNLHAKAIIGHESNGVWCIAGSANFTQPALNRAWLDGGNLELVNFYWSADQTAFDYLLNDPEIRIKNLVPEEIKESGIEPSERVENLDASIFLSELSFLNNVLEGVVTGTPEGRSKVGILRFLRSQSSLAVELESVGKFRVEIDHPLTYAEAAKIEIGGLETPFRWINQPAELSKHGQRAYRARVKGKIETFDGSRSLFKELLDFLWDRVDPDQYRDEDTPKSKKEGRKLNSKGKNDQTSDPPPSAERFITDEELVETIGWGIERHHRYDRSTLGLRDLLSMVLLRLTTETQVVETVTASGERDEDLDQDKAEEQEARRISAIEWLRNYLIGYCKRYGRRLANAEFVSGVGPYLLFQNHFTLGRILLEFFSQTNEFTRNDLEKCFWWLWAPLVWPEIIGFDGDATICTLSYNQIEDLNRIWHLMSMPEITSLMIANAFDKPPGWEHGLWNKTLVEKYLVIQELLKRMKGCIGIDASTLKSETLPHEFEISSMGDTNYSFGVMGLDRQVEIQKILHIILDYQPPTREKFRNLISLSEKVLSGVDNNEIRDLRDQLGEDGFQKELDEFLKNPKSIISLREGDDFCPKCFGELTTGATWKLGRGEMILCTVSKDAWIYQIPEMPKRLDF